MIFLRTLALILSAFAAPLVWSQTVQSICHTTPANQNEIIGTQLDKRLPIASVSKLVTSYWALKALGPQFQYSTGIYVQPLGSGQFDLHLRGARDPYFGQEKLHYLISELNKRGLTQIRNMTFDENFIYLQYLDIENDPLADTAFERQANRWVWFNWYMHPTSVQRTLLELKKGLLKDYEKTAAKALKNRIQFFKNPKFSVKNLEHLPSHEFIPKVGFLNFSVKSTQLVHLLKEMNRNSNNFAAVEFFNKAGGKERFAQFIKKDLNLGPDAILFHEGSGNRVSEQAQYNEASCRALLTVFKALDKTLAGLKLNLHDVISVIGEEGLVDQGTNVSGDFTSQKGVAKTGTVDVSISLGGVLNSKPEKIYFMINVKPKHPRARRPARNLVGAEIQKIAKMYSNSISEFFYRDTDFISYDSSADKTSISLQLK
jgi:D-alanyl-D-alanine carboxypeptidase/D-alanyl-D-alanine-endopeptidase (penicillin-binding protein 4)